MADIEAYYQECLKNGANEYQVEESKKQTVSIKSIIGDPDILQTVAENFIQHYETRVKEGSTVAGKCMFVCADRFIAYDFYKIVKQMRSMRFCFSLPYAATTSLHRFSSLMFFW